MEGLNLRQKQEVIDEIRRIVPLLTSESPGEVTLGLYLDAAERDRGFAETTCEVKREPAARVGSESSLIRLVGPLSESERDKLRGEWDHLILGRHHYICGPAGVEIIPIPQEVQVPQREDEAGEPDLRLETGGGPVG